MVEVVRNTRTESDAEYGELREAWPEQATHTGKKKRRGGMSRRAALFDLNEQPKCAARLGEIAAAIH